MNCLVRIIQNVIKKGKKRNYLGRFKWQCIIWMIFFSVSPSQRFLRFAGLVKFNLFVMEEKKQYSALTIDRAAFLLLRVKKAFKKRKIQRKEREKR